MSVSLFDLNDVTTQKHVNLESTIQQDEITEKIANAFDYKFDGKIKRSIAIPNFPKEFNIGLIVGSSGSGKSTLLQTFGKLEKITWNNDLCIASHFDTADDAISKFGAVGLNSIPTWLKPYNVLSTGERFRADMARLLHNNALIDEFTSVINRECAISCSVSISKYIRRNNLQNIVFASCHDDIIEYLYPDWVYNTDKQQLSVGRSAIQRPQIILRVTQCSKQIWSMFAPYHYLSAELNSAADCYLASWKNLPVAFIAILSMPGRFGEDNRFCVSEHRVVVLPDYQGMGIGNTLSEYIADLYVSQGYRYFGKTANPRMGEHRIRSSKWRATSSNLRAPKKLSISDAKKVTRNLGRHTTAEKVIINLARLCYSHEYIGDEDTVIGERVWNKSNSKKLF